MLEMPHKNKYCVGYYYYVAECPVLPLLSLNKKIVMVATIVEGTKANHNCVLVVDRLFFIGHRDFHKLFKIFGFIFFTDQVSLGGFLQWSLRVLLGKASSHPESRKHTNQM